MIGVATMRRLKGVQEAYVGFVIFHRKIHIFKFGYLLLYSFIFHRNIHNFRYWISN